MSTVPRPGWYRDPAGTPDRFRWWDGSRWSDHLADSASAPAPAAAPDALDSAAVETAESHPELLEAVDGPRRHSPLRAVVALVLVVALFLSAGLGVGLWLWDVGTRDTGQARTGGRTTAPGSTTGPSAAIPAEPGGRLDQSSRTATIGSASMELPDDPYELASDPLRIPGVLNPIFMASAGVHDRYDGEHDWTALVALAAVDPAVAASADLSVAGKATLAQLAARLYGTRATTITDTEIADRSVDGYAGVEITAKIHYAVDRLPSRYDRVRAIVVKLDDGTTVAALSSVPDDADRELNELAEQSLDSLTIS